MKQKSNSKIKQLPSFERPREKLLRYGETKLTDAELLAIIFGTGKKGEDVLTLTKNFLKKIDEEKLKELTINEIKNLQNLGKVKAFQLLALLELGRRWFGQQQKKEIIHPKDIWEELWQYREQKKEHFFVYYLDVRNTVIKRELVAIGILNSTLAHPREIFEPAVRHLAAQIILVHNHPSGDATPSEEDLLLTKRLIKAGKILGIEVLDHVIITKDGYFSFAEKKIIKDEDN
jgi:DNA repair protein RadC